MRFAIAYTPAGGKKGKTLKILCIACIALLGIIDLFLVIAVCVLEKRGKRDE